MGEGSPALALCCGGAGGLTSHSSSGAQAAGTPSLGRLSTFQHRQLGCSGQEMAHRALMSGTAVGTATDRGPQLVSHVEQDREVALRTLSWNLCGRQCPPLGGQGEQAYPGLEG